MNLAVNPKTLQRDLVLQSPRQRNCVRAADAGELRIKRREKTRKAIAEVRRVGAEVDVEVYLPRGRGCYAVTWIRDARTTGKVDSRWMGGYCQIQRSSMCWKENELQETGEGVASESQKVAGS